MKLQGVDPNKFTIAVSEKEVSKQLGNAMSVNVVERLLVRLLSASGLVEGDLPDRWLSGEAFAVLTRAV